MMRLLVLAGVAVAVGSLLNDGFSRMLQKLESLVDANTEGGRLDRPPASRGGQLVACAGCGVHVVRDRALAEPSGLFYCTETCRCEAAPSL